MSILEHTDESIKAAHQHLAEVIEHATGANNFVLAKGCFGLLVLLYAYSMATTISLPPSYSDSIIAFFGFVITAGVQHLYRTIDKLAAHCQRGFYNESLDLRRTRKTVLIICLPLLVFGLQSNTSVAMILFLCCIMGFYFMSCTPLPPGTRRTRFVPAPARM